MAPTLNKSSKLLSFVGSRIRVTIQDSRVLVGTFMAFDKHMNLVLGDTEEYRRVKKSAGSCKFSLIYAVALVEDFPSYILSLFPPIM